MDHISKILPKVLRKRGLAVHTGAALVVLKAEDWLKERAGHLPPSTLRVEDNVLCIEVSHSIMAQELTSLLPDLQSYLKGALGKEAPRAVRVGRMRNPRLA